MRKKQLSGWVVFFLILSILSFLLFSCTRCVLPGLEPHSDQIIIMSYNTQNIFDEIDNGTEYSEFDPSYGEWGLSQYNTRLYNLSEVIRRSVSGGPDLIALQEIENEHVAVDLVESYLKGMGYSNIIVTGTEKSAIQLGFISRYNLEDVKVHQVISDGKTVGRPILEISVVIDSNIVHVFNNHWKSKLGGAEETEPARISSSALLCRRIHELQLEDSEVEIVILGDLNENWDEYRRINGDYITALINVEENPSGNVTGSIFITGSRDTIEQNPALLYSPWGECPGEYGSYVYNNSWETIDNILLNASMFNGTGFEYKSFSVVSDEFLLNRWGTPLAWKTETGYGYSDHLPILLVIEK